MPRLQELADEPAMGAILLDHAYRGVRIQLALRVLLVAYLALVVTVVPPDNLRSVCFAVTIAYACWSVAVAVWTVRGGTGPVRWVWLALLGDVAAIGAVTLVSGLASDQSWTSYVVVNGLFVIPLLAATQLRTSVCVAVVVPTVLVYLVASIATKAANTEPWSSLLLRTLALCAVAAGAVLLSRVQRSRVLTIGSLARDRTDLLEELTGLETRERRALAETLHDGALQYVLAARQDVEDLRGRGDDRVADRVDEALREASALLRATVTDLHPAVLDAAGLPAALRALATRTAARAGWDVDVDADGWPEDLRTAEDGLVYAAVSELLVNAAKHAGASRVLVTLTAEPTTTVTGAPGCLARVVVRDDGRGVDPAAITDAAAHGHIGVASHRARLRAAGGALDIAPGEPRGTVARVQVPVHPTPVPHDN